MQGCGAAQGHTEVKQGVLACSSLTSVILPVELSPREAPPIIIFIVFPVLLLPERSQRIQKLKQSVIPASALVSVYSFALKNMWLFFKSSLFPFLSFFLLDSMCLFPCGSRTRLHLQLHVLGIHDVQVFGLNDAREHVVPDDTSARVRH